MLQWNNIIVGKTYLYAPEEMSIRKYYYISEKVNKTIKGIVIVLQPSITTISSFETTKENVDIKTDLCTLHTYESKNRDMLKIFFDSLKNNTLDVRK